MSKKPKGRTRENVDLLIVNAEELLTLAGSSQQPRTGSKMNELESIKDGAIAIREGRITAVGKTHEITKNYRGGEVINAKGKTVLPGFVDPHTHLVFAGSREEEFLMRLEGVSYFEILSNGGGALKTAKETRRVSEEKLVEIGLERLDTMLANGTTTVEAKSGYVVTTEDEIKILTAMKRLNQLHCVNVVPTFMGAHVIPPEFKNNTDEYVNIVVEETIPKVARQGLAEFCDVFCERGVFNLEQAKCILASGKKHGLKPKIHADHHNTFGGAEVAADIEAVSAEHLNFSSVEGIRAMAEKGVVAILLPAATFSLMMNTYADARFMIEMGVPVALGTDFNASCWIMNQQLVIAMACHFMHLTPAEAITAATINAAHAVCRAQEVGSLEVGKKADITILGAPNHKFLGYSFGGNLVEKVIKNGRIVVDREKHNTPVFMSKTD